jgi:hypothetical protein
MADRQFTDLELERFLADDLPAARKAEIEATATEADRAQLAVFRAQSEAFLAGVDVAAEVRAIGKKMAKLPAEPRRFASWWRWVFAGGALAAAAAALLIIVRRDPRPSDDDLAVKGGDVGLIIHTENRQLADGDNVKPGERIRFAINAGTRGYVAVAGIDATGSSTVYFPFHGEAPAPVDPTVDHVLPGAIALDATPGSETFYVLYSKRPFSLPDAITALRDPAPGTDLPPGVASSKVTLVKDLDPK